MYVSMSYFKYDMYRKKLYLVKQKLVRLRLRPITLYEMNLERRMALRVLKKVNSF